MQYLTGSKSKAPAMPERGFVMYSGASVLDGAPIVVIATMSTSNVKTGQMVQTWILRADINPVEASKSGDDSSICGNCVHRHYNEGACYVNIGQAPNAVYKGYQRGIYPVFVYDDHAHYFAHRKIRLGAYGDPAAVPVDVWRALASEAKAWTGYSHQWQESRFAELRAYCMASVDNEVEYSAAIAMGWRAFRVRLANQPLARHEIACPASEEAGTRTQCVTCRLCAGAAKQAKNIAIIAHGLGAKHFATA